MKQGWEYKKLGEVCQVTMGQSPDGTSINNLEGIEFHQGKTCFGDMFLGKSNQYTTSPTKLAEANSVLLCVRAPVGFPNITKREICIGRGLCSLSSSTELDNFFLFYALLGKQDYFEKNATGSTFKAISSKVVNNTLIPLPPLPVQQSIVAELDEINHLLSLKRKQLETYDKLAQSLFYEMFGDPVENEKGWEVKKLGEIGELARGVSKHRPRNAPELLGGTMPLIQTGDVANADFYINSYSSTYSDLGVAQSKIWESGTLCITIAATIGKCAILGFTACFPDSVVGFKPYENTDTIYMYYIFSNMQKMLEDFAPGVAQKNINLKILNDLKIPLPPLPLQQQFAQRIEAIEAQKANVKAAIEKLETLLAARMQYWFE